MKKCVLYDRDCIECGECNMCDLEPGKICDNCMRCVEGGFDYNEVVIDDVIDDDNNALPAKTATDKAALKAAWRELKRSGKWNREDDEFND